MSDDDDYTFYEYRFEKLVKSMQKQRSTTALLVGLAVFGGFVFYVTQETRHLPTALLVLLVVSSLVSGSMAISTGQRILWFILLVMPLVFSTLLLYQGQQVSDYMFYNHAWIPILMALASKMPFLWLVVSRLLQQVVLSVHFWLHSKPCAKHDLEQCTQMLVSNTCLWVTLMIVAHFFEITERQAYRGHSDYVMLHSHLYVDTLRKNEAKEHRNEEAYTQLQEKYTRNCTRDCKVL